MSIDPPSQPDSDVYKTLLESTKAIPWRIDWQTKLFSYFNFMCMRVTGAEKVCIHAVTQGKNMFLGKTIIQIIFSQVVGDGKDTGV